MATFFRLLADDAKGPALREALADPADARRYDVAPEAFREVPSTPFAYWVSDRIRQLFTELPPFESEGRKAAVGLQTSDDPRFVRCWWEVPAEAILDGQNGPYNADDIGTFQRWCRRRTHQGKRWVPFAKGGAYSPYYADLHLVVNWVDDGRELKAWADPLYGNSGWSRIIKSVDYYFRPGLTWPLRGLRFSAQLVPPGAIFSIAGKMAFVEDELWLSAITSLFQSSSFDALINFFAGKVGGVQYEVGIIKRIPTPSLETDHIEGLRAIALQGLQLQVQHTMHMEASKIFRPVDSLKSDSGIEATTTTINECAQKISVSQNALEDELHFYALSIYNLKQGDLEALIDTDHFQPPSYTRSSKETSQDVLSFLLGTAFGRWDVRYATGERTPPELPDPFAPLPVCSPGMLQTDDGLPCVTPPDGYPVAFPPSGLIVQDATQPDGPEGLLRRLRHVLYTIYGDRAGAIEQEAVDLLGAKSLDDYFARPTAFFDAHLKQYSMSRRKAPIYWPLGVPSGRYTVWCYAPRLTEGTLYTLLVDHLAPRLEALRAEIAALETTAAENRAHRDLLEERRSFATELEAFRGEVERITMLPYWPSLHDGIIICAAPLHGLFQHRTWSKACAETWAKLEAGDYDWAHVAHGIWPTRVEAKCRTDKSLAIAHDREALYEGD